MVEVRMVVAVADSTHLLQVVRKTCYHSAIQPLVLVNKWRKWVTITWHHNNNLVTSLLRRYLVDHLCEFYVERLIGELLQGELNRGVKFSESWGTPTFSNDHTQFLNNSPRLSTIMRVMFGVTFFHHVTHCCYGCEVSQRRTYFEKCDLAKWGLYKVAG